MKKVVIAQSAGMCSGVKRAVNIALSEPVNNRCVLGGLVHNDEIISKIKAKGIVFVPQPSDLYDEVVVSAHGVTASNWLKIRSFKVLDATCPNVARCIEIAKKCYDDVALILIGDSEHDEIKAVSSYAKNCFLFSDLQDKQQIKNQLLAANFSWYEVVFQTTLTTEVYSEFALFLLQFLRGKLHINNTICSSVTQRILEAKSVASDVDVMVVVGDKTSANCTRLYEECKKVNNDTIFVSDEKALTFFTCDKVGVTAGASVSPETLNRVVKYLQSLCVMDVF